MRGRSRAWMRFQARRAVGERGIRRRVGFRRGSWGGAGIIWKAKYKALKARAKRLQNRVNDLTKSREHWREQVRALREENAALREQAALKKYGPAGPGR